MEVEKGQYFLLAGVLIVLMLVTLLSLAVTSTTNRLVQVEPQEEAELLLSNIDGEISRFAEALIVRATKAYFEGRTNMDEVRREVVDRVRAYIALLKESRMPIEFQLNIEVPEPIRVGGVTIPPATLENAVERRSLIKIRGYSEHSIAALAFYYSVSLDEPVVGFVNLVKKVYLKADVLEVVYDDVSKEYKITFHAETEKGNGTILEPAQLWLLVREDGRLVWKNYNVTPTVISWANGTYQVIIDNVEIPYPEFYILKITDERGVVLELTQIPYYKIQLRSRAFSSINDYLEDLEDLEDLEAYGRGPSEAYTVEMLANGTLTWNFKKLPVAGGVEPIPLPPIAVGNIRVNITDPDTGETWVAPLQVEDWIAPGTKYERPVEDPSRFIKTGGRLDSTDKLVFLVNFTDPNTGRSDEYRNVTIWWIRDPDLLVTPPIVTVDWDLSGLVNFSNGVYNMSVIVSRDLIASYAVDFSISISYKDYHVEIATFSYGWSFLYTLTGTYSFTFPKGTKIITPIGEVVLEDNAQIRVPRGSYVFKKEQYANGTWVPDSSALPAARIYLTSTGTLFGDEGQRPIPAGSSIILPPDNTLFIPYNYVRYAGIWFPRWLPGGEPPNTLGWRLYNGTVRALLYRSSDVLYNDVSDYNVKGIVEHNETIIVAPGNYVVYRVQMRYLDDLTIHNYHSILTMISGTSSDYNQDIRLKYYAYYNRVSGDVISGRFSNSHSTHVRPSDYSLWDTDKFFSQYRGSQGGVEPLLFGIVVNVTELVTSLSNVSIEDSPDNIYDTIWIWTTADYARRVVELDKINYRTARPHGYTTIYAGSTADYVAVFWMGPAGSESLGYESIYSYSNMFYYVPEVVSYEVSGD